ncbi:MAG: hypothetical protein U0939_26925 [Pirellulales bacterium]
MALGFGLGLGTSLFDAPLLAQNQVQLQPPIVRGEDSEQTDAAWQSRSTGVVRPQRAPANAARLPNAGPAIRVNSVTAASGASVRWKVRDSGVETAASEAIVAAPAAVIVNRDANVRAVTELQLNDPRRDPFGEARVMRTVSTQQGGAFGAPPEDEAPPTPQPSDEPSLDAPQPGTLPPADAAPEAGEPGDDAAPLAAPRQIQEPLRTLPMGPPANLPPKSLPAAPPRKLDLPAEPPTGDEPQPPGDALPPASDENAEARNAAFCRRLYNERNCCSDENACNAHRAFVKSHPLSKISLDITPTCNLTSRQKGDEGGQCGFPFEQSPTRTWRDRAGREMARGRVTAMANLRVEVTDDEGNAKRIRVRDLGEDDICFLAAWCGVPSECRLDDVALAARNWTPVTMTWKASGLCHKPLYFEQEQLERYGHTAGPIAQPIVSGAHFFANIALLPYNMGIHPPNECQYALGYYRPGSCAPWMIPPFPLSVRGALAETGVVLGGVFLIP